MTVYALIRDAITNRTLQCYVIITLLEVHIRDPNKGRKAKASQRSSSGRWGKLDKRKGWVSHADRGICKGLGQARAGAGVTGALGD